jgi:hypothetical protein
MSVVWADSKDGKLDIRVECKRYEEDLDAP